MLVTSVALNVGLLFALRAQYIDAKILAANPDNAEKFAQANERIRANDKSARRVIFFGDSRIAQWEPEPGLKGTWSIVNRGIAGETTAQMRLRFRSDVLDLQPDVVLIQAGINDLVAASLAPRAEQIQIVQNCIANLLAFANEATANGINVVILTIFPPAEPPLYRRLIWNRSIGSLVDEVNTGIETLRSNHKVTLIETEAELLQADGTWHEGTVRNTLHLTSDGYARLNAVVTPTLDRLLADAVQ